MWPLKKKNNVGIKGKAWNVAKKTGKYGLGALIPAGTISEGYTSGRDRYNQGNSTGKIIKDGAASAATMGAFGAAFGTSYWSPFMKNEHDYLKKLDPKKQKRLDRLTEKRGKHWYNPFKKSQLSSRKERQFKALRNEKRKIRLLDFKGRGRAFANNALWGAGIFTAGALGGKLMQRKHEKDMQNQRQTVNQVASSEVPYINVISFDVTAMRAMYRNMRFLSNASKRQLKKAGHPMGIDYVKKQREGLEKAVKDKFGITVERNIPDELKAQVSQSGGGMYLPNFRETVKMRNKAYRDSVKDSLEKTIENTPIYKNQITKYAKDNNITYEQAKRKTMAQSIRAEREAYRKGQNKVYFDKDEAIASFKPKNKREAKLLEEQMLHHELTEGLRAHTSKKSKNVHDTLGHWNAGVLTREARVLDASGYKSSPLQRYREESGEASLLRAALDYSKPLKNKDYKKAGKKMEKRWKK